MIETAEQVVDLVVASDANASAANAIYDEIAEWCANQRRWQTRLWNFLRPWHTPVAPHVPMVPKYWRLLVMIREPEDMTEWGFKFMRETTDIESYLTYVGMVVAHGKLAFKAVTRAKLKLSREDNPKLGDTVVFYKNAGTRFKTIDGLQFVLITDTEVWGVTDEPKRLDTLAI
jgi:co-chaperonin GroES (HSP10)